MLSILGAGSAYASGDFPSGAFVKGPGSCLPKTVLPVGYLEGTGNSDPLEAPKVALESPTDLAFRAASIALERAGITPEQIGMIIGDCATPREKTPSEAQRLGKRFGVKVPAFDVTSGSAAFVQHLDVVNSWQEDRVPDYVLLVSSNCPSENLNWSDAAQRESRFCDAAAALVVSTKHAGKLVVRETFCTSASVGREAVAINTFGFLALNATLRDEAFSARLDELVARAVSSGFAQPGNFRLICSFAHPEALRSLSVRYNIAPEDRWFEQVLTQGDSFGSTVGRVLADRWSEIGSGRKVLVAVAGSGSSYGFAVLE